MGYERNNAIIVSGRYEDWIDKAHAEAVRIFNQPEGIHEAWNVVTPILVSPVNSTRTFLVGPDGSKEGWPTSETSDERRAAFVAWLDAQRYDDLSSPLDWVEVQYGDDDHQTVVVHDSDAGVRAPCPAGCEHQISQHGHGGCFACACPWER